MGTASISTVVPSSVTQGSAYDVTLSGFSTSWDDNATVSFGEGVTVTRVKAASPTSLLVHVTVAPDALTDVRDVSVTQAGTTVYWRNAFSVLPRIKFSTLGTANQLSLSVVRLQVNEPEFEFDTSRAANGQYLGVQAYSGPEFPVQVMSVSAKTVDTLVLADLDAGTGAYDLNVISRRGTFAERTFSASQVFTVLGVDQHPLVHGVPESGTVTAPFQSTLYKYTPVFSDAGTSEPVMLRIASSAPQVSPKFALLPDTGRWRDAMTYASSALLKPIPAADYYLVVWESSGATGFSYTLTADTLSPVGEEEPNDTAITAQRLTVPGLISPGQLSSLTDRDWVKVTATSADVGKRFHVVTQPGDLQCDTVVEVLKGDGFSTLGGPSSDDTVHEDHYSSLIPEAGDYFIRVWASTVLGSWDLSKSHYELLVTVE